MELHEGKDPMNDLITWGVLIVLLTIVVAGGWWAHRALGDKEYDEKERGVPYWMIKKDAGKSKGDPNKRTRQGKG